MIEKEYLEELMGRIMARFDRQDHTLSQMNKRHNTIEGERLLDNQDLCQLLNVSKRTLQRYRSSGELAYHTIYHKTYYKESDVQTFIKINFDKKKENVDN